MMMEEFKITAMTTNLNGPEGTQDEKRAIISKVLRRMTPKPAIAFGQEIGASRTTKPPWKVDGLKDYEICPSSYEAGIAWDTEIVERIHFVDQAGKALRLKALAGLVDTSTPYDETHVAEFAGGRTAIVVLRHKKSAKKMMCVSWHGKSAKAKAPVKKAELFILLDLVNGLLDDVCKKNIDNKCDAVIVGGDFNIPKAKTGGYLSTYSAGFVMVSPSDERDEEDFKLDYFLWRGTECFKFETDTRIVALQQDKKFLDHNPAVATFSFKTKANPEVSRAVLAREDWAALDALASFFQMVNSQRRLEDGTLRSDSESSESSDSTSDPDSTSGPSSESDDPDRRKRRSASDNACDSDSTESDSTSGPSSESDSS